MIGTSAWTALALLLALPARAASDLSWGGHVKLSGLASGYRADDLQSLFSPSPAYDLSLDARLKSELRAGPWEASAHGELLHSSGDSIPPLRALAAQGYGDPQASSGLPDDGRRLLRLTSSVESGPRSAAVARLDRLYGGYLGSSWSLRLGRQAVSWGDGLAFQVLDFVNPFTPLAVDKEYKTGDDMLSVQWTPTESSDLQLLAVPRRDPSTGSVVENDSSYALKLHAGRAGLSGDLVAGEQDGRAAAGAGVVKSLGGAVVRLDAAWRGLGPGGSLSAVANVDRSWNWFGRNVYGFLEYFRSGVGEADPGRYASPNAALARQLSRSELFALGRDEAAAGVSVELHPLLNASAAAVQNLDDGSALLQLKAVYDWKTGLQWIAAAGLPVGGRGSEYGGFTALPGGPFIAPARSLFVRAAWYF